LAEIVAELELDTDSIIDAMLHDCMRTPATHEEIAKLFGQMWPTWWRGHQADPCDLHSKEEKQMENLRKMHMAMPRTSGMIFNQDLRRLSLMRTKNYQPPASTGEGLRPWRSTPPSHTAWACNNSIGSWRTFPSNTGPGGLP
jgi:(p)ppGpp synthase/HD superfamily hydrolase